MSDKLTKADITQLEKFADRIFAKLGIDVAFTRHFLDRVNDERNKKQITLAELTRLFKQAKKSYGKSIAQMGKGAEAVLNDIKTDINMPFALVWDKKNNELDLVAKTVMRKKGFKTPNKVFRTQEGQIVKEIKFSEFLKESKEKVEKRVKQEVIVNPTIDDDDDGKKQVVKSTDKDKKELNASKNKDY